MESEVLKTAKPCPWGKAQVDGLWYKLKAEILTQRRKFELLEAYEGRNEGFTTHSFLILSNGTVIRWCISNIKVFIGELWTTLF